MNEVFRQILAGLIAAISLAVMAVWLNYEFWFNLIISGAIGLGAYFTIPGRKDPHEIEVAPGVTQAQLDAAAALTDDYAAKFSRLAAQGLDPELRSMVQNISETLKRISINFAEDPRDLKNAAFFLENYMVRSYKVISRYVRLAGVASRDGAAPALSEVKETIRNIDAGVTEFYDKCLENDFIDLEVEAETLQTLIDFEMPGATINDERSSP